MSKITYITTAVLIVIAALFAILNSYVWTGFAYFTLSSLTLLAIFWGVLLIYRYYAQFKPELEERFRIFRAEKINTTGITAEIFNASEKAYRKEFNKKLRFEKIMKWFYVCFCFACAIAFVLGMIFM